jgi:hypothetical protein
MSVKTVEVIQKRYLVEVFPPNSDVTTIEVDLPQRVSVLLVGTQGPKGAPGASGAGFIHTQSSPATEWIVNHNLGFKPVTEVFDTGGNAIDVQVLHMSDNQLRIYLTAARAGLARCV